MIEVGEEYVEEYLKDTLFGEINALSKGGRIDAAHHNGHAVRALSETLAFDKAIEVKLELYHL